MERLVTSNLRLGIIAGGQLGKMLIQEASKWDIITYVLDMEDDCPAGNISSVFIQGNPLDYQSVYEFGKLVDVLTFEIENVNIEALEKLKNDGLRIVPDPGVLKLIQDKGLQKEFYRTHQIPTSPFNLFFSAAEIRNALKNGELTIPFVQKLRKGGYDGRGVMVINSLEEVNNLLEGASVVEEKVEVEKEIAIIAARNEKGEIKCFPPVEMVFDEAANLVEKLVCPSLITENMAAKASAIAARLIQLLDMSGVLAVEFFIDKNGELLVNEVAPRPHNSGHHTIESVITSQFEQHLRAILNLPLGSTHLKMPSVMLNLLGEPGHDGPVKYEGLTESMAIEGVKIHLYGKKLTRHFRKMGHVTILAPTLDEALIKTDKVKHLIKVKSWNKK